MAEEMQRKTGLRRLKPSQAAREMVDKTSRPALENATGMGGDPPVLRQKPERKIVRTADARLASQNESGLALRTRTLARAIAPRETGWKPLKEINPRSFAELYDLYAGNAKMADLEPAEQERALYRLALHQQELTEEHLAEYKRWLKDTDEGKAFSKVMKDFEARRAALKKQFRQHGDGTDYPDDYYEALRKLEAELFPDPNRNLPVPYGISVRVEGYGAENLPPISPALSLVLSKEPMVLVNARRDFITALEQGLGDGTPEDKLCRIFAKLLRQNHRLHADAGDNIRRNRLDNASIALLGYGIVRPRIHRGSHGKERIGFAIDKDLLRNHARHFLAMQQYIRAEKSLSAAKGAEKTALAERITSLLPGKDAAAEFFRNEGARRNIREPLSVFETVGNRLDENASRLPVATDTQSEDTTFSETAARKRPISGLSLDKALEVLEAREVPETPQFASTQLEEVVQKSRASLNYYADKLVAFREQADMFAQRDDAEDDIRERIENELLLRTSELNSLIASLETAARKQDVSDSSKAYRQEHIAPMIERGRALRHEYMDVLADMINLSRPAHEVLEPGDTLADESLARLAELESQNQALRELFDAMHGKITKLATVDLKPHKVKEVLGQIATALESATDRNNT